MNDMSFPFVPNVAAGPRETTGAAAPPFVPASAMPSFDEVMHTLRHAAETGCLVPRSAAAEITESRAERSPTAITYWDNFARMTSAELHDRAQKINAEYVTAAHTTWKNTARHVEDAFTQFDADMRKLHEGWDGEVAQRVWRGVADYVASSDRLVNWADGIAYSLGNVADAVIHTRASVPPPPEPSVVDEVMDWFDDRNTHAEDAAKQQALTALHEVYQPGLSGADTPPVRPLAHNPVAAPPGPATAQATVPASTDGSSGVGSAGQAGISAGGAGSSVPGADAGASTPASNGSSQSLAHHASDSSAPAGGSASIPTAGPPAPRTSEAATTDGDSPASDRFGSGGAGSGVGGDTPFGGPAAGDAGPLAAPPPLGTTPGPRSIGTGFRDRAPSAKPVASGLPGMPGMGSPGRREDRGHKSPSYLVNVDNGNKLIGPLDKATPPVIGVWNDDGTHKSE